MPTHSFSGYGCLADLKTLSSNPQIRDFRDSPVDLIAARPFEVLFLADQRVWITDNENWDRNSRRLETPTTRTAT